MLDLRSFNNSLVKEAQKQLVTFEEFKNLHKGIKTEGGKPTAEAIIASITEVVSLTDGYKIIFESGKELTLRFNGTSVTFTGGKNYRGGVLLSDITKSRNMDRGHLRYVLDNQSFLFERLIGICHCIDNDIMPIDFRGLAVNVMDGTGNMYTAQKLGLMPNFNITNLEWTLKDDNLVAGRKITGLVQRTGSVWSFSANDIALKQIYQTKDNDAIKKYCEEHLEKIK